MYAKISGTTVTQFPYTFRDLRQDFPNVSFPKDVASISDLSSWNVAEVEQASDPTFDPATEYLVQGVPVPGDPLWMVTRVVTAMTQGEKDAYAAKTDRAADLAAIKADAEVLQLLKARPGAIDTYIDNNVTNLAEAKTVLKILARASAVLAQTLLR